MWAYQLIAPAEFRLVDVPVPAGPTAGTLKDGQVLLRTLFGGICGSDIPKFLGRLDNPLHPLAWSDNPLQPGLPAPPGRPMHETVGEVMASAHPAIPTGARVVGWATHGLAEFSVCSGDGLHVYDRTLTAREAILLQPLACVMYALGRVPLRRGAQAVLGVGSLGTIFGHLLKSRGADWVIGVDPVDRHAISEVAGFDEFIRTTSDHWAAMLTDEHRPEVVFDVVGHQPATLQHAIAAVRPQGLVYLFGFPNDGVYPLDMLTFMDKGLTLVSSRTFDRRRVLAEAEKYLLEHRDLVDLCISHTFPLAQAQEAYELAASSVAGRLKVTIDMAE